MSSQIRSNTMLLAVALLLALTALSYECQASPVKSDDKPEPISDSDAILMMPKADECKEDERPAIGMTPECEPTCDNPKPACLRIFIFDYVPCFCKEGLVRETKSRRCIKLSECPARN